MGQSVSEVYQFGPCKILINDVEVGHTDEVGAKLGVTGEYVEAFAGKWGMTPVKKFRNGGRATVEFAMIQTNFVDLEKVIAGATKVTSGADSKLTFGKVPGVISTVKLTLRPEDAGETPVHDTTIPVAVPTGDWEQTYSGANYNKWPCKFEALVDEAGGTDGNYLFTFGDPTITGDTTPPTVSNVDPADDETDVVVSDPIVWTISEDLNRDTVNPNSVHLIKNPAGAGAGSEVAGTVVLVNAGAATTITFTPSANLDASTIYTAYLEGSIKDLNGNALAPKITQFTTAA